MAPPASEKGVAIIAGASRAIGRAEDGHDIVVAFLAQRAAAEEEAAECVRWLASDKASYVLSTVLTVSGGR